jgi:uncharacterized caspase-like protein
MNHSNTLAIILGASKWPTATSLSAPASFKNSAQDFKNYLLSPEGINLQAANLLDLFDEPDPAPMILERIVKFLKDQRTIETVGSLLFYYVGHGAFEGNDYFLALRSTNTDLTAASSLRIRDLARAVLTNGSGMRRFLILDCCFAAAAYSAFQSPPLQVAVQRTQAELPSEGTALLCASGARDPALAPKDEPYTMFTGALLQTLKFGTLVGPPELSFVDVGDLATAYIRDKYANEAVRPEVHTPEKRKGDVALIPMFPNAAVRSDMSGRLLAVEKQVADLVQIVRESQRVPASQGSNPPTASSNEPMPLFTILSIEKILRFTSSDGQSVAHLQRLQKMRANAIATDFWVCTVSADGPITNLALDGDFSPALESRKDSGQLEIIAKYKAAIPLGKTFQLRLDYDINNSFSSPDEYIGHQVQHQTDKITLQIEFGVRKCLSAEVHRKFAGSIFRLETPVEKTASGSQLRTEIGNLRLGEEYRLAWRW